LFAGEPYQNRPFGIAEEFPHRILRMGHREFGDLAGPGIEPPDHIHHSDEYQTL